MSKETIVITESPIRTQPRRGKMTRSERRQIWQLGRRLIFPALAVGLVIVTASSVVKANPEGTEE